MAMPTSGWFDSVVSSLRQTLALLPDKRTGKNTSYRMEDAGLSAFGVFFTQSPSFLEHQKKVVRWDYLSPLNFRCRIDRCSEDFSLGPNMVA